MDGTLAAIATGQTPLEERLRLARELARAVSALHARGRVHGALSPSAVLVVGGAVVLAPPATAQPPLARAGYAAPEVARGGRATRRSDAFALGALAQLALTGRGPFDAPDALEATRRVLFDEPRPARLDAPALSPEQEAVLTQLLEKRPRRRARPEELARVLGSAGANPVPVAAAVRPPIAASALVTRLPSTSTSTTTSTSRAVKLAVTAARARALLSRVVARIPQSPLHRAGLAAVPLLVLALAVAPSSDAALARAVEAAISAGDLAGARQRLEEAARAGADRPLVEKLRGDLACARGLPTECVRRYRTALAARPELRDDAALRRNARTLLGRDQGCGARRAAAQLLGELRDPEALPALESARRSGGLLAFLCTGDAIDRAIAATRTAVAER
ncbi:MAG TPA: serine/threonine protein kinase [Anaeromyxobacter sp.]